MDIILPHRPTRILAQCVPSHYDEAQAKKAMLEQFQLFLALYTDIANKKPLPCTKEQLNELIYFIAVDSHFSSKDYVNKFSIEYWLHDMLDEAAVHFQQNESLLKVINAIQNDPNYFMLFWIELCSCTTARYKNRRTINNEKWRSLDWENLSNSNIAEMCDISVQYASTLRGVYAPHTVRVVIPRNVAEVFNKRADLALKDSVLAEQFGITVEQVALLRKRRTTAMRKHNERKIYESERAKTNKQRVIDNFLELKERTGIQ